MTGRNDFGRSTRREATPFYNDHSLKKGVASRLVEEDLFRGPQKTPYGVHPSYPTHTTLGVGGLLQVFDLKGRARRPRTRAAERGSAA